MHELQHSIDLGTRGKHRGAVTFDVALGVEETQSLFHTARDLHGFMNLSNVARTIYLAVRAAEGADAPTIEEVTAGVLEVGVAACTEFVQEVVETIMLGTAAMAAARGS